MKQKIMSLTLLLLLVVCHTTTNANTDFTFHGFRTSNLTLSGVAVIRPNGLLALTNGTRQKTGFAFYPTKIIFKNSSTNFSSMTSFSTSFVFGIIPEFSTLGGHGISFVIAPQPGLPGALPNQHMGLFNKSNNNGNITNHIIAVELDTMQSPEFHDINDNHVGIDINRLDSVLSRSAGYYSNKKRRFQNLNLISGKPIRVWIEYDGGMKQMTVTIASIKMKKPSRPLLSLDRDLSEYINPEMYVGFASSTGSVFTSHYLLGWSFKINGKALELKSSMLPKLPRIGPKKVSKFLTIGLPLIISFVLVMVIGAGVYYVRRKKKFAEEIEDWELDYGPHRFKYKDLYFATNGFSDDELLGTGGFGQVYRGFLASSKTEVAVKRVSHQSRQGMREFVAEIVSMGQLRHRNLVQLIGYCRRKKELLLVYEYMPGGSLDKLLYNKLGFTLSWSQRFLVIKGVASGLFYLHEGWEQIVIHRDVKSGNVLLDKELNGKLGDFGLARLYNHGDVPHTTHVVGTLGYLAPEQMWTGKVTEATDVYAFGAFLLEVACGRRPVGFKEDKFRLVEWVFCFWKKGLIFNAVDPNLGGVFDCEEVKLVMKVGLLCSNTNPLARPTMRQVVEYLEKDVTMPELSSSIGISASGHSFGHREGLNDLDMYPSSMDDEPFTHESSMADSLLFGSR
ncbi:L-type lectin-domain containing receptor kinase IV.1-like [Impatiens glandulifera]|uniref:L-type lectin-domain containing receptor kinase IV.1-like n=1 Tax=Impatiens glandulifera TaxID=253017 RepID=UPI001FB08DD8|nr:L-type lectin-domain containing receptor kinase IV.1-like [Impatiens glandulifera]